MRSNQRRIRSAAEVFEMTRAEIVELVRIETARQGNRQKAIAHIARKAKCTEAFINKVLWRRQDVVIHGHQMMNISAVLDEAIRLTEGWARRRAAERGGEDAGQDAALLRAREETAS